MSTPLERYLASLAWAGGQHYKRRYSLAEMMLLAIDGDEIDLHVHGDAARYHDEHRVLGRWVPVGYRGKRHDPIPSMFG